jgi:membrane protease YdiL (CAAX protease family)
MIVEELFFRYLVLGHLRTVMGMHGAVWVSSVMFGMAHVHAFGSVPILIVVGAGLGYMRVMSGSLAVPMLMHGLHNAAVLAWEGSL